MVCDLEGEERTEENMEVSDGLLLQVNNGEQWCNRWKHPNDDSVSNRSTVYLIDRRYRSYQIISVKSCFSIHMLHRTGPFMCVM